ncbi:DNA internalization-related competence protein ComEC/Rec2 [Bacillus horti]
MWQGNVKIQIPQEGRNPGAFNYQQFLRTQYIYFTALSVDTEWTIKESQKLLDRIRLTLDQRRNQWIQQTNMLFSEQIAPIVQAMTVGYRTDIDRDITEMYQQLGIVHILAISGLHVGIVVYSLYAILMQLPLTKEKVISILLVLIPIFIYLAGAQPSVIRAGLMAMLGLVLLRYGLWKHSLLILYLVFIINLLFNPMLIYQIGFQLSYFVTFMLIVASPYVNKWLQVFMKSPKLTQPITIAIVAELAAFPFLVYNFHLFSPLSLLVNIIVIPLYSLFFIPAAFLLPLLSYIHPYLIELGVYIYEKSLDFVHVILGRLYDFPFTVIYSGEPSGMWLLGYFSLLLLFYVILERKQYILVWLALASLCLWIAIQVLLPYIDSRAHITLLDVGQGEAIVIEAPYRREVVLVDVGGQVSFGREDWMERRNEFEVGRGILLPYLRYRGINKVDKVIFTHGHYDHYGGIQGLLGQIAIKRVYKSPIQPISEVEEDVLTQIKDQGIPIYGLRRGDYWGTTNSTFQVLFPQQDRPWIKWEGNPHDFNIVLLQDVYGHRFLWTGDAIESGEHEILDVYPGLKIDVLKLGHHGSQTSTTEELLVETEPKIGLISVGRNNLYRHPHPEILERLSRQPQMSVFRTDHHGGIVITVSQKSLKVRPTLQEKR